MSQAVCPALNVRMEFKDLENIREWFMSESSIHRKKETERGEQSNWISNQNLITDVHHLSTGEVSSSPLSNLGGGL